MLTEGKRQADVGITVQPVSDDFAAEIGDVDLAQPPDDATLHDIKQAFWRYAVLVFPDQRLSQEQHVAFAARFGPLETSIVKDAVSDTPLRVREDIADVSNLGANDAIWDADSRLRGLQLGNRLWHTDSSFKWTPAQASLLYAREIPPLGGQTEFADARAAWDALDDATREEIEGRVAEHSLKYSRERMGYRDWKTSELAAIKPVPQMLVRTNPDSGRRSIFVASHAGRVFGLDDATGRALIDRLIEHVSERRFVYHHRWREGDLVMWDNRSVLHRGLPFDDLRFRRDMHRATVADRDNSCVQEGVSPPACT